jgi:hypothetical protein
MYTLRDGQIVGCDDLACISGIGDIEVQQVAV